MSILVRIVLFFSLLLPVTTAPKPLEKFENRTLVPTDWADGDSFRIWGPLSAAAWFRSYSA